MHKLRMTRLFLFVVVSVSMAVYAGPISYQGQLQNSGTIFSGTANFDFNLFDAPSGGNQIGATIVREGYPVNDGLFQVELDFGESAWAAERWLEIRVNGSTLSPRQRVTDAPKAVNSLRLGNVPASEYARAGDIVPFACVAAVSAPVTLAPGTSGNVEAFCPPGRVLTGGGCNPDVGNTGVYFNWSMPHVVAGTGTLGSYWRCRGVNESSSTRTITARAICCGP